MDHRLKRGFHDRGIWVHGGREKKEGEKVRRTGGQGDRARGRMEDGQKVRIWAG